MYDIQAAHRADVDDGAADAMRRVLKACAVLRILKKLTSNMYFAVFMFILRAGMNQAAGGTASRGFILGLGKLD
jgi:hypothetical protein